MGLIGALGIARAGDAATVGIALLLFGSLFAFSVRMAVMRRPLMVIDSHGFTEGRSGRTVSWDRVAEIRANTHQGAYGLDHSLRIVLNRPPGHPPERHFITTNANSEDEIEVSLDRLAAPREDVITAIEHHFGHPVLRTSDAGFQNVRRRRGS